ncbi:MAG: carbohydrate binding domain-containing protein, partial [Acholeplasmataceae bacterium]|nr:carbohydrate binding domain-containing protein [Acholeplasmataceae bacterium]
MKKTFTFLSLLFVLFLFACTDMSDDYLTIEITGIEAVEIIVNEEFDVKAGVVATGNDDVDYTDQLRITSLAGITDGKLNTSKVGRTQVYYDIEIEEKDFFIRKVRDVNIIAKPKEEGVFLANGDFSEGTTYWEIYDGGGKMHLEVVEGILEVEITQVGDVWEPRFSQMDIPFEKDQAYRVFFKAKADEP